jgi:glycerophosphoryl diester phosphodiesterase
MTDSFVRMGHRGAAAYATENTLSSIETALACNVDMVEVDVRRTKDGVLMLGHEPFLKGQGQTRMIRRSTYAQLKQLCLPGGEVAPTLEEALRFIAHKATVNIDIKESGLEAEIVSLVKKLGMDRQVMFSGLNTRSLRKIKQLNPQLYVTLSFPSSKLVGLYYIRWLQPLLQYLANRHQAMSPIHFVMRLILPFTLKRMAHEQIDAVIIRAPFISSRLVEVAHKREWKLYTWPVDEAQDVEKLRKLGVDGIGSNRPDVLQTTDTSKLAHQ